MKKNSIVCVILAGGIGARLWPLSTKEKPKQVLSIAGKSLLAQTIERALLFTDNSRIFVSTTEELESIIKQHVATYDVQLIIEKQAKNTAPALMNAVQHIEKMYPDSWLFCMPSDAFIPERQWHLFLNDIHKGLFVAQKEQRPVLMVVPPNSSCKRYGYLYIDKQEVDFIRIKKFIEKPSEQEHIKQTSDYYWNTGIFCVQMSLLITIINRFAPELLDVDNILPCAIDHALWQQIPELLAVPLTCQWSDVGTLESFIEFEQKNEVIEYNSSGNKVYACAEPLVVLAGVQDLFVIQTDSTLIIAHKNDIQNIQTMVKNKQFKKVECNEL